MLVNIVRFDSEDEQPNAAGPTVVTSAPDESSQLQKSQRTTGPGSMLAGTVSHDLAWMQQAIDQQMHLFEAAQWEKTVALSELKRLAQTLCKDVWDSKLRVGESPDEWPPQLIAELIIQNVGARLRNAHLSQDPELAEKQRRAIEELARLRADNHSLHQRVRAAEDVIRELKAASMKDAIAAKKTGEQQSESQFREKRSNVSPARDEIDRRFTAETQVEVVADEAAAIPASSNIVGSGHPRVDGVIRFLAETGLCRWKDISARLANLWEVRSSAGTMDAAISKAIRMGLVRVEEVRLEWGGKPTGKVLLLTEQGLQCAVALNIQPVESQYTKGLALHKDGAHFYAILEVAAILATQYAHIDFFPSAIAVTNGKYYPDVTATDTDGARIFVEVERATYKDGRDRDAKWLRAAEANHGSVYLATPNQEAMMTIIEEINQIRGRHPEQIARVLAFNVRAYRESKGAGVGALWAYGG